MIHCVSEFRIRRGHLFGDHAVGFLNGLELVGRACGAEEARVESSQVLAQAIWIWKQANYGILPSTEENLRRLIPAATLVVLGIQTIFSSFFMSALGLKTATRKPPGV